MNAQVVLLSPIPVVTIKHVGPYDGLSPVFETLWGWVEAHNIPVLRTIGIYYDNPDEVPAQRLRSAACVEVRGAFQIAETDGLPLELMEIAGGSYVTTRYVGPYEDLEAIWTQLTSYTEGPLGKQISDNPAFEVYANDASETPASQLITELYMPVL